MEKNKIEYLKDFLDVEIIKKEAISEESNYKKNNQVFIKEGIFTVIKNLKTIIHIVKPNESLEIIAKKYNKKLEEILIKNNISNIFVGQQLLI
ncbi:MAG: LysM peptidoglycan-binding domain-containing protein [Clostridia bacterium]|nr:LysM peptidoglycan-binding domain-containing protein [Clostridia bacterium]